MRWRRSRDNETGFTAEQEIIAEAERLLSGQTLAFNYGRRQRAWTLIGALGHCDREHLRYLAATRTFAHPSARVWNAALTYLAGELLAAAPSETALIQIQRQIFVPLELRFLGDDTAAPTRPAQLVDLVWAAFDAHHIHPDR